MIVAKIMENYNVLPFFSGTHISRSSTTASVGVGLKQGILTTGMACHVTVSLVLVDPTQTSSITLSSRQ